MYAKTTLQQAQSLLTHHLVNLYKSQSLVFFNSKSDSNNVTLVPDDDQLIDEAFFELMRHISNILARC